MKDAYYFSHDSNARNDPKIQALMSKWGYEGYGWWWAVLETLREQPGYRYPLNKYTYGAFARMFCTTKENATEFLSDCFHEFADEKGGLLIIDEQFLWSESFSRRMFTIDEKREKARKSVSHRWTSKNANTDEQDNQQFVDTNEIRTYNERITDVIQGKESKVNIESIIIDSNVPKKTKRFVKPTLEEVKRYCDERGSGVNPETFHAYYESNGWYVGKRAMKDWKAAIVYWEKQRNDNPSNERTRRGEIDYGTV